MVADDDSSIRSVLKHNNKELFDANHIPDRPRYDNGKLRPDNGKLPINHCPIHFFSDRNHRVRTIARELFILGRKKLADCIGTTHDAERMKRNLSYSIRMNCSKELSDLEHGVKSVLEHHFNNHEFCGTWCQCKGKTTEEMKDLKLKYHDKQIHAKYYEQCKIIFNKCLLKIKDVHHQYNSNLNEGMNKLICKFVPKDRGLNGTREYETRVNYAVCVDSIGYLETMVELFNKLDMKLSYNIIRKLFAMDKRKIYKRNYYQKIETKRKRIQTLHDKLRKGEAQLRKARAKEQIYLSGINYTEEMDLNCTVTPPSTKVPSKKQKKTVGTQNDIPCKSCGMYGHTRKSSHKCRFNKKHPDYSGTLKIDFKKLSL